MTMSAPSFRVLVTPIEACRALLEAPLSLSMPAEMIPTGGEVHEPERLAALLGQVDAAVLGVERVTANTLVRANGLRVISRFGVGYDAIDLDALRTRGIRLTNTPGCMAAAVARQATAFLLAIAYNLHRHDRALKAGRWDRMPNASSDLRVGVVGLGHAGREFARLSTAFGFQTLTWSRRSRLPSLPAADSLETLLRSSDVVSLHLSLTPETRSLIGERELGWMDGKALINTSRGAIVDESAVLAALNRGRLTTYATDVFVSEPPSGMSAQIAAHDNVMATPHVAAMDTVTARQMLVRAVSNAVNCLSKHDADVQAYVL
jgi:phosphoglycerate dehydrogenase-like enzyme